MGLLKTVAWEIQSSELNRKAEANECSRNMFLFSRKSQYLAWKAVHIACDVGNRVHTRNDSDEDVRGNACQKDSQEGFTLIFH